MSKHSEIRIGYGERAFTLKIGDQCVVVHPRRGFSYVERPSDRRLDRVVAILGPEKSPYLKLESGRLFDNCGDERGKGQFADRLEAYDEATEREHAEYAERYKAAVPAGTRLAALRFDEWTKACLDPDTREKLLALMAPYLKS